VGGFQTGGKGLKFDLFDGFIWLLEPMEQQPKTTVPVYVLHKDWKGKQSQVVTQLRVIV